MRASSSLRNKMADACGMLFKWEFAVRDKEHSYLLIHSILYVGISSWANSDVRMKSIPGNKVPTITVIVSQNVRTFTYKSELFSSQGRFTYQQFFSARCRTRMKGWHAQIYFSQLGSEDLERLELFNLSAKKIRPINWPPDWKALSGISLSVVPGMADSTGSLVCELAAIGSYCLLVASPISLISALHPFKSLVMLLSLLSLQVCIVHHCLVVRESDLLIIATGCIVVNLL